MKTDSITIPSIFGNIRLRIFWLVEEFSKPVYHELYVK